MLAAVGAAVGAVLGPDIDDLGILRVKGDRLDVGLLGQSPGQVPDLAVGEGEAEDAASRPAPPPSHTGINI